MEEQFKEFTKNLEQRIMETISKTISKEIQKQLAAVIQKEMEPYKKYVGKLEQRIMELENSSKRNYVEIKGIKVKDNQLKDTVDSVMKKIGITPASGMILQKYATGKKDEQEKRATIVVEMRNSQLREDFIKSAKQFMVNNSYQVNGDSFVANGGKDKVFIGQLYCKATKTLLYKTKQKAKESAFKYVWVDQSGKILARKTDGEKAILISSQEDIEHKMSSK